MKLNKFIFLFIIVICLSSLANSLSVTTNNPLAIKQNTSRYFNIYLANDTNFITTTEGADCYFFIQNEQNDGQLIYVNTTNTLTTPYFFVDASNFTDKGLYSYYMECNTSEVGFAKNNFYVTGNGDLPAGTGLTVFIYLIFILASVGLFITFFLLIAKMVTSDVTIYDVLFSWGAYILLLITIQLSQAYLINTYIETLSIFFSTVTRWTNGVLPLIALAITMIVKSFQKGQPLGPNDIGRFR